MGPGIADGVQVNSVLPGPVMTGRRQSYLEHWAPLHNMTVEEATAKFPLEAGIARYGPPEEIAESQMAAFLDQAGGLWMSSALNGKVGGASRQAPRSMEDRKQRCSRSSPTCCTLA